MKIVLPIKVNKAEYNRLKQIAKQLEYDDEMDMLVTLIERLIASTVEEN